MNKYKLLNTEIDSIDLKCLVVSKGVKIDKSVYKAFSKTHRLGVNPLMCNGMILSDGTIVQLTDMGFPLQYLTGILSCNNLKLLKYACELETPFSLKLIEDKAALYHKDIFIDFVSSPPKNDFYFQRTSSGLPFILLPSLLFSATVRIFLQSRFLPFFFTHKSSLLIPAKIPLSM